MFFLRNTVDVFSYCRSKLTAVEKQNPPQQKTTNKIATVFYTWAQSYGVSTQQPSVLHLRSLMALLHQHGHLCSVVQGCTLGYVCAWSMERWLGVIQLSEELAYTSWNSLPKLRIITLLVCQHLSGPTEEPVTHSCFIPVTLAHSPCMHPQGAPAPLKAMFTIPFVSWFEKESYKARGCAGYSTTVKERYLI